MHGDTRSPCLWSARHFVCIAFLRVILFIVQLHFAITVLQVVFTAFALPALRLSFVRLAFVQAALRLPSVRPAIGKVAPRQSFVSRAISNLQTQRVYYLVFFYS
jgi:ABC-type amino acid transport system permease subunit